MRFCTALQLLVCLTSIALTYSQRANKATGTSANKHVKLLGKNGEFTLVDFIGNDFFSLLCMSIDLLGSLHKNP